MTKEQVNEIRRLKFRDYASIKKTHDAKTLKLWRELGFMNTDIEWYVSGKVHGANFSFIADGNEVLHAERRDILEFYKGTDENKNFFDHQNLAATTRMDECVRNLSGLIGNIQLYTELYGEGITGSSYLAKKPKLDELGNEIERLSENPVIKYHPVPERFLTFEEMHEHAKTLRDYIMYDCMLLDKKVNIGTEESPLYANEYLTLDQLINVSKHYNIPMVPILFRGTYDECMEYVKANPTPKCELAKRNGVEEEQDSEGYVLKPCKAIHFDQGSVPMRVLVKQIADKFAETKLSAEIHGNIKAKIATADKHLADAKIIEQYVTEMRVTKRAAGLGIGVGDKAKFGALLLAVKDDIVKDVKDELGVDLDETQVKNACVPFVKAFFG